MIEERQMTPDQEASLHEQVVAALNQPEAEDEMNRRHPPGRRLIDAGSVVVDENGTPIATQVCWLRCVCRALGLNPLEMIRILGLENNTQPLSPAQQQRVCDYLGVNVCEYDAGNENRRKTIRCNSSSDTVVHIWLKIGHYYLLVPEDHDTADQSEMDSRVDAQVQPDMAEAHRLSEAEAEADAEDLSDVAEAQRLSELDAQVQAAQVEDAENWWAEFQAAPVEDAENRAEFQASQVQADLEQQQQDDHEDDYEFAVRLQADILEAQRRAEAEAEVAAQILADNETARVQQLHEDYKFARMLSPRAC